MIDAILQDVRYAFRSYRKAPGFAAGVVLTIGFGLGFVCSAFTVVNGYLLKPFDLRDPDALHELSWDSQAVRRHQFTIDDWTALQASKPVFSGVAAFAGTQISGDDGLVVYGQIVTGNYFDTLGVRPFLGRLLESQDAARPGDRAVAVLAHSAWLGRFGADPSIVGREIRLGRSQFTVVGVAQPGFAGFGDAPINFFVPVTMAAEFPMRDPYSAERPALFNVVARLDRDVTVNEARAWFTVWLNQRLAGAQPEDAPTIVRVEPRGRRIPLTPRTITLFSAIVAAFGLVLLIACANVANTMLARGLNRQREIAVRLSVGAARARVVRQLLIESIICAVPAAVLGYAIVSLLAIGALLVAFSGTYSVVAYLVTERTREFGIRMALGATVAGVVRSVLGEALRLGARGLIVGGTLALALSVALASVIEIMPAPGLRPYFIGALIVLLASAIAAAVPSLRASRVDPAVALRTE